MDRPLVLASGSPYRARLLAQQGLEVVVDPPGIDEREADGLFTAEGPEALALELARRKARAVAGRHPGAWVLAGDQVGVLGEGSGARMLTKREDPGGAVEQLLAMSGSTHRLVNGLVVLEADSGRLVEGVDVQAVTMRRYTEDQARAYVEAFEPFDTAGSYRLEDGGRMGPGGPTGGPFVESVVGEDPSGVVGLPMPLLRRLLERLGGGGEAVGGGGGAGLSR